MISDLGPITDMNGKKLPSGMVLSPPDFGVLVFLDGILDNGQFTCGAFSFAAFNDSYFAIVLLPQISLQCLSYEDAINPIVLWAFLKIYMREGFGDPMY